MIANPNTVIINQDIINNTQNLFEIEEEVIITSIAR